MAWVAGLRSPTHIPATERNLLPCSWDSVCLLPLHQQMQGERWKQEELLQLAGTRGSQVPPVPLWFTSVGSGHSFSYNIMAEMDTEVREKFLLTITQKLHGFFIPRLFKPFPFPTWCFPHFKDVFTSREIFSCCLQSFVVESISRRKVSQQVSSSETWISANHLTFFFSGNNNFSPGRNCELGSVKFSFKWSLIFVF